MSQSPETTPETALIIEFANRFEAIATDGYEGKEIDQRRDALIHELTHRAKVETGLIPAVAHAVGLLARFITDSDPKGRFTEKVAILQDMEQRIRSSSVLH